MTLDDCCVTGVKHEGVATGEFKTIGGTRTYVAFPEGEYDQTQAVLFLSDVFGVDLINNKLLVDSFAKNGLATYAPDFFDKDSLHDLSLRPPAFDRDAWSVKHTPEANRHWVDGVIKALRESGVKRIAAVGYCYGGRYVADLALEGEIQVAAVAHPSKLKVPEDLQALKEKASHIPFLWNTCEHDKAFDQDAQKQADMIFAGDKNYKRNYYPGNSHGYAVKGDLSDPVVKAAKEDTFKETVDWFKGHL